MKTDNLGPLHLHEECLLLAIGDRTGTVLVGDQQASLLAAAAMFAELFLDGVIVIEGREKQVMLQEPKHFDDPNLDGVVHRLSTAKARLSLDQWISRFACEPNLVDKCVQRLCDRGILKSKEETILWFFNRRYYPELDPEPENRIRDRILEAIASDGDVEPKTASLVGLAAEMDLLKNFVSSSELKQCEKRIQQISNGDACAKTTAQVLVRQQMAAMSTATFATMICVLMD